MEPSDEVDSGTATPSSTGAGAGAPATAVASITASAAGPGSGGGGAGGGGDGGAGGAPPSGTGGAGGSGGGPPGVVPGCEQLAWVGEPVAFEVGPSATPRIATLANGDVGLVYADRDQAPDVVESRVIAQPFASWPPRLDEPAVALVADDGNFWNEDPFISVRGDGVFSLSVPGQDSGVVARMGEAPLGLEYEGGLTLDPQLGAGGYVLAWRDGAAVLDHFATLDAGAIPTPIGVLPPNDCWAPSSLVLPDGSLLLARASILGCENYGPVELLRATRDGIVAVGSLPAAFRWKHELISRPGGAWLVELLQTGVSATPVDARGAPSGRAWIAERDPWASDFDVTPWRDGFAIADFGDVDGTRGARLRVSDGVNVTVLASLQDDGAITRVLGVSVSADGSSILVAHEVHPHVVVQRADCMATPP